jgi:hypothetical protein
MRATVFAAVVFAFGFGWLCSSLRMESPAAVVVWRSPVTVVAVPVRAVESQDYLVGCIEASIECRSTRRVDLLSEDLDRTREVVCTCDEAAPMDTRVSMDLCEKR